MTISSENHKNAEHARKLYIESADPVGEAQDWAISLQEIRLEAEEALNASFDLRDIQSALESSGSHMRVFRHLLAPPKSQDQFALLCPSWSKSSEKSGRPLKKKAAEEVADTIQLWMDQSIAPWLKGNASPSMVQRQLLIERIASFVAPKMTETQKRNRLSAAQENAVVELLKGLGWKQMPSVVLDERAAIPAKHFMHKTRFATATTTAQEVDIACGFSKGIVAAMECKVTNDTTNSVKRINDVLKKSAAWKAHYGSFVETAALLQGVIKAEDVQRLTDEGVVVFWSHNLGAFSNWVQSRV